MAKSALTASCLPSPNFNEAVPGGSATHDNMLSFAILLLPGFSSLSLSAFLEPFYQANWSAGESLFNWRILGKEKNPVVSSSGLSITPDMLVEPYNHHGDKAPLIIIGGDRIEEQKTSAISMLLHMKSRQKLPIVAIGTAPWLLADAGVLNAGMRCTIHWSKLAALAEKYPELVVEDCLFVRDGQVITCAGEFASFDLAAELISLGHGEDLARRICAQLSSDRMRAGNHCQSLPAGLRYSGAADKLIRVIKLMERNLENPLPLDKIADTVGLSRRQVERLFAKHLKSTPMQYYSDARLRRARQLLEMTDMSVIEVAIASGFVSSSHFSKNFRDHFGIPPSHARLPGSAVAHGCTTQGSRAAFPNCGS